jgi:hypothetical protein
MDSLTQHIFVAKVKKRLHISAEFSHLQFFSYNYLSEVHINMYFA